MSNGVPAKEAIELFNQLIRLQPSNTAAINTIRWRLKGIQHRLPGDSEVMLTLMHAEMMLGDAGEAINLSKEIWHRRHSLQADQYATFAMELCHLGIFDRALELLRSIAPTDLLRLPPILQAVALQASWFQGDIDGTREIVRLFPNEAATPWEKLFASLEEAGLLLHLSAHQKVVNEVLFGHQCFLQITLSPGIESPIEAVRYAFVGASHAERLEMEDKIHSALDTYYASHDLADAPYWDLMLPVILDVTAAATARTQSPYGEA